MATLDDIARELETVAPRGLAEEWDNVGLLVGDRRARVQRVMTCLTITPASAAEAVREQARLIVAHHPLPFRPLKRITSDTTAGGLLLDLIAAKIAIHSPHTAFDSAREGINQRLAEGLGLENITPLVESTPCDADPPLGAGRFGPLRQATSLGNFILQVKKFLQLASVRLVGDVEAKVERVAVGCGSAGELMSAARRQKCDAFVTGEANFHTCLEAEATGMGLILVGHYASERFAVEHLAEHLAEKFRDVETWASRDERDPLMVL